MVIEGTTSVRGVSFPFFYAIDFQEILSFST